MIKKVMNNFLKLLRQYWPILLFLVLYIFIFRKVFFQGLVPFPGDLLTSWFFPYNAGGWEGHNLWITHKEFILADVVRQIYPWRVLAVDLIKDGVFPLWNIYSFAGNPLLADMQSAIFYPMNILFLFIESRWAWIIYIMVQPILATYFMYLFIRSLKMSRVAAMVAGIGFAFIGYIVVWFEMGVIGHAALWLPLILWGMTRFFDTKKVLYLVYAALGIGCSILAGHAQTSAYVLIFAFAYFVMQGWGKLAFRKMIYASFVFVLGVALASIQIFPSLELMQFSPRDEISSTRTFHQFITPPSHMAMLFAPDFFGNPAVDNFWGEDYGEFMSYFGVVILLLGVIGFCLRFKEKLIKLSFFTAVIAFLIAFVPFVADLIFYSHIPILSTGLPSRTLFLVGVAFVIASAFGVEAIQKEKTKRFIVPLGIVLSAYVILWVITFLPQFDPSKVSVTQRNLLLPTSLAFFISFLLFFKKYSQKYMILWIVIFACMAFEYSYFLNKYLPMAPMQYMFPQQELVAKLQEISGNDRVYGYDTAAISTNLPVAWKIQSVEGYDPLYIKQYSELTYAAKTGKLETDLPRSDAILPASLPNKDSHNKQVLMNLLGVKYVLDKDDLAPKKYDPNVNKFPPDRFELIYQEFKWKIYENKKALPRAVVFYDYTVISDNNQAIKTLYDKNFAYNQRLILASKPTTKAQSGRPTAARIQKYSANQVEIITDTKQPGILFLSDNLYPGWEAKIDGKDIPILRADYSFRGVEVPKGEHKVSFEYRPKSFYIGLAISVIAVFLLTVFIRKRV